MHAWPIFWLQNTKKVPITGESTYANKVEVQYPPRKNHVSLSFSFSLRGVV